MEKLPTHVQDDYHRHGGAADSTSNSTRRRDRLSRRSLTVVAGLCFALYLFVTLAPSSILSGNFFSRCHKYTRPSGYDTSVSPERANVLDTLDVTPEHATKNNKVPLEAHIMSKCPDAQYCLQQLIVPAMEQISDKVDFQLSFIASVSNKTTDISCMHGPSECIGDMLMLCAENLPFPSQDSSNQSASHRMPVIRSLGYANCLIGSYSKIPERQLVEQCALEHGIEFDALNHCASEPDDNTKHGNGTLSGVTLLRQSALHSEALGVKTSCTVRLNDSVWCVRDGRAWKNCVKDGKGSQVSVLVDEVKRLWDERN